MTYDEIKNKYILTPVIGGGTGDDRIPYFFDSCDEAMEYFLTKVCNQKIEYTLKNQFKFMQKHWLETGARVTIETVAEEIAEFEDGNEYDPKDIFKNRNEYISWVYRGFSNWQ